MVSRLVFAGSVHFGNAQSEMSTSIPAVTKASGGNGSLELTLTIDKTSYSLGEPVNLTLTITNISNKTINYTHTGLDFDFQVTNGTNNQVYQWSNFRAIAQFIAIIPLAPGESSSANFTWQQISNFNPQTEGDPLSPGTYNMIGETGPTYKIQTTPIQITILGAPVSNPTPSSIPTIPPQADYAVNASAGPGGTINPSGILFAYPGSSFKFHITPDAGYQILDVSDNGISKGSLQNYEVNNVQTNHQILATFSKINQTSTPATNVEHLLVVSGQQVAVPISLQAPQTVTGSFNISGTILNDTVDFWVGNPKGATILDAETAPNGKIFTFTASNDGEYVLNFKNHLEYNEKIDLEYSLSSAPLRILGLDTLTFVGVLIEIVLVLAIAGYLLYKTQTRHKSHQ